MSLEMCPSTIINEDHGDQSQGLLYSIKENLEPEPSSECCIYRVPKRLRMVNEKAYTPQLVSIGPFHHGKEELSGMEKRKESYLQCFLNRISITKQVDILNYIKNNEQRIRNYYVESSNLKNFDFVTMILRDAIFILELFMRYYKREGDFYLDKPIMYLDISIDIILLENQLPYFLLEGLYKLAFDDLEDEYPSFKLVCSKFFSKDTINNIPYETSKVLHFTDLSRCLLLKNYPSKEHSKEFIANIPNATQLYESGVKFKCLNEDCFLDIRLKDRKQRIPCFKVKELQIPSFGVQYWTEPLVRNIMALEQLHYSDNAWICNYVDFLDRLIETEKDVDLLRGEGIIHSWLGDNASVANMFNKLCDEIAPQESCYYIICKELKAHYNPWNHTKATLKSVYFSNLWRGTATVAAVILLLLTVTQTVFSIL